MGDIVDKNNNCASEPQLGDVIQMGPGPFVHPDLVGKHFIVEALGWDGSVKLSEPFLDARCTLPFVRRTH